MIEPPLLALAKGIRARPRKAKAPRPKELALHMAVAESTIQAAIVDYIAAVAPTVICYAVPNASRRTAGGRASNAVPGLLKGVFDLGMILSDGRTAYIEVKTAKGVLSDDQEEFRHQLSARRVPHCVARSIDDVRAAFDAWGVPTRESRPVVLFGERAEAT